MPDCHAGRNSVGIYYHVGHDSFTGKWQVLLTISHTASTLLTMSTGKFVSDLWYSDSSHLNFSEPDIFFIGRQHYLINDSALRVFKRCRAVFIRFRKPISILLVTTLWNCLNLSNDHVVPTHLDPRWNKTVNIEFVVTTMFDSTGSWNHRLLEGFIILLRVFISPKEHGPEEPSVNSALINHNRIFLVIPSVASYCYYWVAARRKLLEMQEIHWSSCH